MAYQPEAMFFVGVADSTDLEITLRFNLLYKTGESELVDLKVHFDAARQLGKPVTPEEL